MLHYIPALLVFICQEAAALIVFPIINRLLGPETIRAWDPKSLLKGVLERFVLIIALIHGYPQMLIAFSAMKLGTRLHEEKNSEISNTYFLIGNLLSILFAMISAIIIQAMWKV